MYWGEVVETKNCQLTSSVNVKNPRWLPEDPIPAYASV